MALNLNMSEAVTKKLSRKHHVTRAEIEECFLNRHKGLLEDSREQNKTNPPTRWFIAETDEGRLLKIVFMELNDASYEIKTAYEPNSIEVKLYEKYA